MHFRDRIKEFRRVRADQLQPHPRNWRTHGEAQQDALRGVLAEVGYADALLVRELADGSLQLVDGHLRAEVSADALVPVLVLDVNDDEALKLLATLDPLAAMAGADQALLAGLVAEVESDNEAVRAMLAGLLDEPAAGSGASLAEAGEVIVPASFQVVVECRDEAEQRDVFERLRGEGLKCRVLSL
jgi:hypothetical protein